MASESTADQIRDAQFRVVLRGLDRVEVEDFLASLATRVEQLETELRSAQQAGVADGHPDLETEFDAVGQEVTAILQTAREAADAIRERATADAARWRAEAIAEVEEQRRDSASDAEALRRDAWTTGTELITQADEHATRIIDQAEREVLTTMGEAEREAHRLTSAARRDAEELIRNATMTAEKLTAEATDRRDDIIDAANRQASVAQERTRALEQRRDELLEELENVRSTLSRLEGSLEEKREEVVETSTDTTVRVVPAPEVEETREWAQGETVRVVQTESKLRPLPADPLDEPETRAGPAAPLPDELNTVRVIEEDKDHSAELVGETEPVRMPADEEPEAVEPPSEFETEPEPETEEPPGAADPSEPEGEVESLFAALRNRGQDGAPQADADGDDAESEGLETDEEASGVVAESEPVEGHDWIGERDNKLLPITNRALRGTKKAITEMQNIALDRLRTDADWRPDPGSDADLLSADLIALWAESFAAGHSVAETMTGTRLKRPPTPDSDPVHDFPSALSQAVTKALDAAGEGQRERQTSASKVYRVWRSDEAEQRIRELAIMAYQQGVERSVASRD